QRRRNVAGAFRIASAARLKGSSVLLVDDVLTTGATASACARALKQAGARRVSVLALARTDRRSRIETMDLAGQPRAVAAGASQ
ncbi:MAG: ComF family protein, partial [bacterium]|nr:ComF family protein [bacterium]